MADPVYQPTTVAERGKEGTFCAVQRHLTLPRLAVKVLELVLSFVAFLFEELVEHCEQCGGLYFFEFVSCTAFLLCIVAMVAYCTKIADKITLPRLKRMDVWFTVIVGTLFLLASIIFAATKTGSHLENTAVAFGFLASFTFVTDLALLWKAGARFRESPQREAAAAATPAQPNENEALNNERSDA